MTDLQLEASSCVPCRGGIDPMSAKEIAAHLPQIPGWSLVTFDGVDQLKREFSFNSYVDGVDFANRVAKLAEAEDHHPALLLEWGKVTVTWWTHKINGLHINDFIAAAKTSVVS